MADDNNLPSLEELDASIRRAKEKAKGKAGGQGIGGASLVARVSVELLAGVAVGCLMGYYLDKWLGTKPVFLIVCLILGMAGGMLNIYKIVSKNNN